MKFVLTAAALALAASPALAHIHLTVDTASGAAGDAVQIRAGYLPADSSMSIAGGRLLMDGSPMVFDVDVQLTDSGPSTGWYAGDELLLTSDFYFATGRLDGGNFQWELAAIASIDRGGTVVAWGDFFEKDGVEPYTPSAFSDAGTRLGRSFDSGIAGHDHEQGYAFSAPGLYDVTFIAWDSNGRYADSEPVTVTFNVIPSPGAGALALAALALPSRRRR